MIDKIGAIGSERTNSVQNQIQKYKKYIPQYSARKLPATWFADHLKTQNADASYFGAKHGNLGATGMN